MHLTEAIGIAYNFLKMKPGSVKIRNFEHIKNIYGYVSELGVFPFIRQTTIRLSAINDSNTNLNNINDYEALTLLMNTLKN